MSTDVMAIMMMLTALVEQGTTGSHIQEKVLQSPQMGKDLTSSID